MFNISDAFDGSLTRDTQRFAEEHPDFFTYIYAEEKVKTMINIEELFDKHESESHKFKRIVNPPSRRADLCAFIYLDKLLPKSNDNILVSTGHDIVYLSFDVRKLVKVATEEDVIYLLRCGINYDSDIDSLYIMFV